jgi:hypothetical protein
MQIFGTATSPVVTGIGVGTGASKYSDIVTRDVNTLANGSKASLDDKLNAYQALESLICTRADSGVGILYQTNKNDAERAAAAIDNTDFAKGLQQLASQYCNTGMASARAAGDGSFNVAQNQLDTLARFTPDQQKMIFVAQDMNIPGHLFSLGKDIYYSSLDAMKATLKSQAAAYEAQQQSADANASSVATAPTGTAATPTTTAVNGVQSTVKTADKAAITLLPKDGAPASDASIALQTLLKFQDEMSAEKLAAAALAKKTETSNVPNDIGSKTAAMVQTISVLQTVLSSANPAIPAGHLNQIV